MRPSTPSDSDVRTTRGDTDTDPPSSGSGRATGSSAATMVEVLLVEEATRARGFSGIIALVSLAVVPAFFWLAGDPAARQLCASALLVIGAASLLLFHRTNRKVPEQRYHRGLYCAYGWLLVVLVPFVEYYFGFFSPVPLVLTLGIYYFGQTSDRSQAFLLPAAVIVGYALFGSLTAAGILEDRGLFAATHAPMFSRVFAIVAVSLVLAVTMRMARVSRTAVREAIERSNEALLVAQRREAQLAEAHHQLDRALRVAIGKPGRYTGALAGGYRLGVIIGVGAIGEVYEAERASDGQRAAVKLLQASAVIRGDSVERILREGAISRKLDSPHVVRVFDLGRLADGAPYLVMELLNGRDLAARLRQQGQLALDELMRLADEVGEGLHHAHSQGVIHRDLKPLNIYEAQDGAVPRWLILDFGISKLSSSSGTLTQEGVVGTPGYMSPEQARGGDVDHRSDVFSMGVVLYRAMTGQPAFPGDNTPQIMFDIVYKMPKRPSAVTKGLPQEVDLVMAIALAKRAEDRFQSATELAHALAQACRRKLPADLRERGIAISREAPWGATLAPHADAPEAQA